jgi:serine/threonine protein kinase
MQPETSKLLTLDLRKESKTEHGLCVELQSMSSFKFISIRYLAPEIIQSKGHGKAVDWWALGILIFEMLSGYPPFFDDNPFGIYEKILAGKISFPSHIDVTAQDLIRQLLTADITKRLGNMKNGIQDIKQHPWFQHLKWDALAAKRIRPPIIPLIAHAGDSRNFDFYPELTENESRAPPGDPFADLFRGKMFPFLLLDF